MSESDFEGLLSGGFDEVEGMCWVKCKLQRISGLGSSDRVVSTF